MLSLLINDVTSRYKMYIDYTNESIGFTMTKEGEQIDFVLEIEEWEQLKEFIDIQIKK